MERIREENINLKPGFWEEVWRKEPPWRNGFGIDPIRFGAMASRILPGNRVLDVGGGRGEFLNWIQVPCQKWMVDVSLYGVQTAWSKEIIAAPALCTNLPYRDCFFDVVTCGELIEHLESPVDCIYELKRVCKIHGWVSLSTPHELDIQDKQHVWSFSVKDVENMFGSGAEVKVVGKYIIAHWNRSEVSLL